MALRELLHISSGPMRGLLVLDFGQAAVGPIVKTDPQLSTPMRRGRWKADLCKVARRALSRS
jgi:hypothetical protein